MGLPIFSTPVVAAARNLHIERYMDNLIHVSESNLLLLVSSSINM